MQRAVGPTAPEVIGVVPSIVGPIADADDQVQRVVAFVIDESPLVSAYFARMDIFLRVNVDGLTEVIAAGVDQFAARNQDADGIGVVAGLDVRLAGPDAYKRFDQAEARVALTVLEQVQSVKENVGAGDD